MARKLKLPYTRYVCQVSTGEPRPKAGYLAMMEENLTSLSGCAWRKVHAATSTLTPHDFTKASYFDDSYDAYKMSGAWSSTTQKETAFAGMAAYVFKLPDDYATTEATLVSVDLPISRDRFCLGGVRVAVTLGCSSTPSGDWTVIRGTGAVHTESSLMEQSDVTYITKAAPAAETISVDLTGTDSQTKPSYMIVYVTLENYTDHWEKYSAKEARNYAVEGSAILSGCEVVVEFSADVSPDEEPGHICKIIDQFSPKVHKGLTGWVFALCWYNSVPVESVDDGSVFSSLAEPWISYPGSSSSSPKSQDVVNTLYAMLERGNVHVQEAPSDGGIAVGASFSVSLEQTLHTSATFIYRAFYLLAGSYLLPMRMPCTFAVRKITITWNPYIYSTPDPSEKSTYSDVPVFSGDAAKNTGRINVWLKVGSYIDSYSDSLIKNPRIYDASEIFVDGWKLIGQIDYLASSEKIVTFELESPITSPCASLLFTAFVPPDEVTRSMATAGVDGAPIGICPVAIDGYSGTDPATFTPNAVDEQKTFRPGVILEG